MKFSVVILSFLSVIILNSCNSLNSKPKSPEELRMELQIQEQQSPSRYLTLNGTTMKANQTREAGLFHGAEYDGYLVQGQIKSSASIARFKDVIIHLELLSETETVIQQADYPIYKYFEPNSTNTFSIKVNPPSECKKFNASIKTAAAAL